MKPALVYNNHYDIGEDYYNPKCRCGWQPFLGGPYERQDDLKAHVEEEFERAKLIEQERLAQEQRAALALIHQNWDVA